MSSKINDEEHNPVTNLTMQPVRGILKTSKSIEQSELENNEEMISSINDYPTPGMTRSESKSHKIPHFDEMNIIATYHPVNKDYGHMKIEEPKTPYAPGDNIDEEMDTEVNNDETTISGVDADTLVQRLNASSDPSDLHINRPPRRSIDENAVITPEELEHRKQFENHRKRHYNEFEIVRLHKKEIEAELHALEQEETTTSGSEERGRDTASASANSIKPILVHDHSSSHHHQQHHVHVDDDYQHDADEQSLTPEERERKKQFELKRKKHYNEFLATHLPDKKNEN